MKYRNRTTVIAALCLAVSLAASVEALRLVDQLRPQGTLDEVLYINSPTVLKRVSLGYDGLLTNCKRRIVSW